MRSPSCESATLRTIAVWPLKEKLPFGSGTMEEVTSQCMIVLSAPPLTAMIAVGTGRRLADGVKGRWAWASDASSTADREAVVAVAVVAARSGPAPAALGLSALLAAEAVAEGRRLFGARDLGDGWDGWGERCAPRTELVLLLRAGGGGLRW